MNTNGQFELVTTDTTQNPLMSFDVSNTEAATVSIEWDYNMTWDNSKSCAAALNIRGMKKDGTNEGSVLCVDAKNGTFRISDGGKGETLSTSYNSVNSTTCVSGQTYKLKVIIDFTANRYDFYIDGKLSVSNRFIRRDVDRITSIVIDMKENVSGTTATMKLDNMIVKETNEAVGKAFYVNANSVASFAVDVNKAPGVVFEYEVMLVTHGKDDNAKVFIKADGTFTNETAASNQTAINIGFKYGTINFGGSPFDVAGYPEYDMNVPHKVKIVAKETGFDLYVDGVLIVENHKFMNKVASVDKYLKVSSGIDHAGSATYDYLKISVAE